MSVLKIQVKLYAVEDGELEDYVPVFHRWIRDDLVPNELVIDVVDYTHVPNGPAVVLIGHAADYVLDRGGGRLGLLYANKRNATPAGQRVAEALGRAVRAARRLEQETEPKHKLAFRTDELEIRVMDRLLAPNTDPTYAELAPELREGLARLYGELPFELARTGGPKDPFTVQVRAPGAPRLEQLAARLA